MTKTMESIYQKRFEKHVDELRWLYMELYNNDSMFAELCDNMKLFFQERKECVCADFFCLFVMFVVKMVRVFAVIFYKV